MNYHHAYHAGNFADVFKHLVLTTLIQALLRKEKPLCYLDTHAGCGYYDLASKAAQKTKEFANGIAKLANADLDGCPKIVQKYLETLKNLQYPEYYPGSPLIAGALLRDSDRMVLVELGEAECHALKRATYHTLNSRQKVAVHQQDGFKSLKAFLPPAERRGLILIDPPYERGEDWDSIIQALKVGSQKFSSGVYAVWYPIKDLQGTRAFLDSVRGLNLAQLLITELGIYPADAPLRLPGCGMLILNPPWRLAEDLKSWIPWVWKRLSVSGAGGYRIC